MLKWRLPFQHILMKVVLSLLLLISVAGTCHKTAGKSNAGNLANPTNCFKARLEIKGICMNYVIKVLEGDTSLLKLEKSWTDETDGKVYTNVFALGSVCTFPELNEGAEFYFTLAENEAGGCNVCMAYRPVPSVKNNIVVRQTPCR